MVKHLQKIILAAIMLLATNGGWAQHLEFEGIPINGSITNFQKKLSSKGIVVNSAKSKEVPVGQRVFKGKYQGYNADITVFYGRKTKSVYKVAVTIDSKKEEVIQSILDKSLDDIERKYPYLEKNHEIDYFGEEYFRFCILSDKKSKQSIGLIVVHPTTSYNITIDANYKPTALEFADYLIQFTYEDKLNLDSTVPSDLEPKYNRNLTCGHQENFKDYYVWAANYVLNGCYERGKHFLTSILDYFKYDCVPYVKGLDYTESEIDKLILTMNSHCIGTIPSGDEMKRTNVYAFNSESNQLKFIEFDAGKFDWHHIKLDINDIPQVITSLEQLKKKYNNKKNALEQMPDNSSKEKIDIYLPASIGKENLNNGFGDLEWEQSKLMVYFSYEKNNLILNVTGNDKYEFFVFRFNNIEQIEEVVRFFRKIYEM